MESTYYQTLGITSAASAAEIRAAYRRLAKLHHPDTGSTQSGHQSMLAINEAYEVLREPERRRSYDRLLERDRPTRATGAGRPNFTSDDSERERWLREVYQPVISAIQKVLKPFRRELDELSYDPYDDELIDRFINYLERSQTHYQQARAVFVSRPNPSGAALVAELLFHSLNQLGDGLDELRYFTQNYDYQHLHVGQELLGIVADLRRQAMAAAERLLRVR